MIRSVSSDPEPGEWAACTRLTSGGCTRHLATGWVAVRLAPWHLVTQVGPLDGASAARSSLLRANRRSNCIHNARVQTRPMCITSRDCWEERRTFQSCVHLATGCGGCAQVNPAAAASCTPPTWCPACNVETPTSARSRGAHARQVLVGHVLVVETPASARSRGAPMSICSSRGSHERLRLPPRLEAEAHAMACLVSSASLRLRLPPRLEAEAHARPSAPRLSAIKLRLPPRLEAEAHQRPHGQVGRVHQLRLPPRLEAEAHEFKAPERTSNEAVETPASARSRGAQHPVRVDVAVVLVETPASARSRGAQRLHSD